MITRIEVALSPNYTTAQPHPIGRYIVAAIESCDTRVISCGASSIGGKLGRAVSSRM